MSIDYEYDFTVVTVSLNGAEWISCCVSSVLSQNELLSNLVFERSRPVRV